MPFPPVDYPFLMSDPEQELFDSTVHTSKHYLEFGTGGTTLRALQVSEATVVTVESSSVWVGVMRRHRLFSDNENGRLAVHHVDIGPTLEWGWPDGDLHRDQFPRYSAEVFGRPGMGRTDLVLIDGRFRVACGLQSLLSLHPNPRLRILIHDFWNREIYHTLLDHLEPIDRVETLGLFTVRRPPDLDRISRDYERFRFDPS